MLTEKEKTVLTAISQISLMTAHDVKRLGDGAEAAVRRLAEKRLISEVRPIGTTCYVITIHGTRALSEFQ